MLFSSVWHVSRDYTDQGELVSVRELGIVAKIRSQRIRHSH